MPSTLSTASAPPLPGRLRSVVAPRSRSCVPSTQLTYSDATIEHLAVQDPRVPRLRSVPSIGPVTAAAFLAAIDDAHRFRHAHQLEAYLGLVPGEHSSGETQRRGAITKAGHARTRWLLIQAAVAILRRRPPQAEALRTWAARIAARRGTQVAVVALARRLAGILYALLRDGRVFESEGNINALRALAPLARAPVPRPSRPPPRTPQPRWSRRHSAATASFPGRCRRREDAPDLADRPLHCHRVAVIDHVHRQHVVEDAVRER